MKLIQLGNYWINIYNINWLFNRDGKTEIHFTGAHIPLLVDESIEYVVKKIEAKCKEV